MTTRRTIALLIESSRGYGRGLLRGVVRYARNTGNWSLLHQERDLDDPPPAWLTKGSCDGVIARLETNQLVRAVRQLNVPVVDLRCLKDLTGIPRIDCNNAAVARLAIDHLLDRGFRHVGYCGLANVDYSIRRRKHLVDYLRSHKIQPFIYEGNAAAAAATTRQKESEAMLHERGLVQWLAKAPKPIGIMACNDIRGRQVLSACRDLRIAVPDEVAVVGVDNDEVLCELADPPLSSVAAPTVKIGYEAAALLDRLMDGEPVPETDQLIDPLGVVTRLSSDVLAIDDPLVAAALHYIRDNACKGIKVEDVLSHLEQSLPQSALSRSTLDRRFAELLGVSPKDEIVRTRLRRVQQLLLDTGDTIAQIAAQVGMAHPEHLSALFKKRTGETPGAYRARMAGTIIRPDQFH